jgi:hypothetical protein
MAQTEPRDCAIVLIADHAYWVSATRQNDTSGIAKLSDRLKSGPNYSTMAIQNKKPLESGYWNLVRIILIDGCLS